MSADPEIRISGDGITIIQGRTTVFEAKVEEFLEALDLARGRRTSGQILPTCVRLCEERRDTVGVVIEVPRHARTVRWLADDSKEPFGRKARYRDCYLSFPYVVLLVVFRRGALTGLQQLYYRNEPLDAGEDLLLPNLFNVAQGYGQRCWVCLQHLDPLGPAPLSELVPRVVEHVFAAAFNRSSEVHEGNSYWGSRKPADPKVASLEAWARATRENPLFATEVPWEPADTTATQELGRMLDRAVARRPLRNAAELATLLAASARRRGPRRG